MSAITEIPVTVTDAAAALVEQLGLRHELEVMLDHTKQHVPDLCAIEVTRYDFEEGDDEPRVLIMAWQSDLSKATLTVWNEWDAWVIRTFSPDVHRHFIFTTNSRT